MIHTNMLWIIVVAVTTAWTLADVRLGNAPVKRHATDAVTSGLYQIDPNVPSSVSGPLRSWSVYVSGKGSFAFLVLRRKSAESFTYVIAFSDHVVFQDLHVGEVFTKNCSEPCIDIQQGDTLGFYFGSSGMIPYDEKSSCLNHGYIRNDEMESSYDLREGAEHSFFAAPAERGRCRIYSLQAYVAIAYMQELSRNGHIYNIRQQHFGRIKSQRSRTYDVMQKSILRIVAPSRDMRIKLRFVGSVRLAGSGDRQEPNSCLDGHNDWLDVYEYLVNGTKLQLLPRICGNWIYDNIPVLKDIYSTSSKVYIRFLSLSTKRQPGAGFTVDFVTFDSSLSKVPIYLMETCKPGKDQTIFVNRTNNNASIPVQSARSFPLSPGSRSLAKLNCTITVKGVTGNEEIGLVFTWFQLPNVSRKCGQQQSFLKVYSVKMRSSDRTYALLLAQCGKRNSFVFGTKESELKIDIKGALGFGVAFDIYTSYQYLVDKYGLKPINKDEGNNWPPERYAIFVVVTLLYCCCGGSDNRSSSSSDCMCCCTCCIILVIIVRLCNYTCKRIRDVVVVPGVDNGMNPLRRS